MSIDIECVNDAELLPPAWDEIAKSVFQTRKFLIHTQIYNPCAQKYYLLKENGVLEAGAVTYVLTLNLFTFLGVKSPIKVNIIGIPCSVSSDGFAGPSQYYPFLLERVLNNSRGFQLALNLSDAVTLDGMIMGNTLPSIIFRNRFADWASYVDGMRAGYRRRLKMIMSRSGKVNVRRAKCSDFDRDMYELYRAVVERSRARLEYLSLSFFRNLCDDYRLTVYYCDEACLGWHITVGYKNVLYFFLGGIEYRYNEKYDIYLRSLADIIREGIETGVDFIDLGQTAETPKLRLGGTIKEKRMLFRHTSKSVNMILKASRRLIEYRKNFEASHPFRLTA